MKNNLLGIFIAILTFFSGFIVESSVSSILNNQDSVVSIPPPPVPVEIVSIPNIPVYIEDQAPESAGEYDPNDLSGYYYPEKETRATQHLWISLWTGENKPPSGGLRTDKRYYEFSSVQVVNKTLKFKTERIKGVEYRFEGIFIYKGNFEDVGYDEFVMKGILRKFLNGKEVGRIKTRYMFTIGC